MESGFLLMATEIPPLPEGFTLDQQSVPPLPEGFTLDIEQQAPAGAGRQAALTGRAVGEGVASAATFAPDMIANRPEMIASVIPQAIPFKVLKDITGKSPLQLVIAGFNKAFGTEIPESETFQEALEQGVTDAGAPVPQTDAEKMRYAGVKGASAAVTGGAGVGVTGANVVRAGLSGASGAGASEYVKQQGGGQGAQLAAGLIGGIAPMAAEQTARTAAATVTGAVKLARPLTRSGQEQIAANVLAKSASDPRAAARNLDAASDVLPGSTPTAGPASGDVGLLALEKGLRGKSPAAFGARESEQNTARQIALEKVSGTVDDIKDLKAARGDITTPLREAALASKKPANPSPVVDKIDEILASPKGERVPVKNALMEFRNRFDGKTEPARLYEIRKDIGDAMEGKLGADKSVYRLAKGELIEVRKVLDDQIEESAPGFKAYLDRYKELSKPINEREVLQEIQRRSQSTVADITSQRQFLAPAQFRRAVDAAAKKAKVQLTPEQTSTLKAVQVDLDLGNAINSKLIKAPGSDTFQNLSIASAITSGGKNGVHPFIDAITKPLKWVYKAPDEKINEILADAMLDPKFAASLLKRATPARIGSFSADLMRRAKGYGIGTTAAQVSRQSTPEQDRSKSKSGPE